jgi:hypothetical protein
MQRSISASIAHVTHASEDTVTARISHGVLVECCMSMCMLYFDIVQSVSLADRTSGLEIIISMRSAARKSARGTYRRSEKQMYVSVTSVELGYWVSFLLRYYRDGVAEVDHMDVDLLPSNQDEKRSTLIFRFEHAASPLPGDDLRRKLGL